MPRQMPTTLRPRFCAQTRGGSLLLHVPNRRPRFPTSTPPPGPSAHPSGFSIRSQQDSFGSNPTAHQRLPFVPPLPRSSIPGSATMIPQTCSRRLSETPKNYKSATYRQVGCGRLSEVASPPKMSNLRSDHLPDSRRRSRGGRRRGRSRRARRNRIARQAARRARDRRSVRRSRSFAFVRSSHPYPRL